MAGQRNAGIAAGVSASVVGLGYFGAKALARLDRRRYKIEGDLVQLAESALSDPPGTRTSSIATHDGGRMFVRDIGSKRSPVIVLLHGVTLDGSIWSNQLADLAAEFRVIAPDWRGHGHSTAGREGFGLDLLAKDLATLLDALNLHNVVLVGHSMGGMAVMHFCHEAPEMLREQVIGIVFESTAASDVASGPLTAPLKLGRFLARQRPDAIGRLAQPPGDVGYVTARFGFGKAPSPVWVEQTRILLDNMAPVPLAKSVLSLLDHDARDTLRTLEMPVLVLVGTNDLVTPLVRSKEIAELISHARLQTFEDAGHLLMLERREELSGDLREFAWSCLKRRSRSGSESRTISPGTRPAVALP